MLNLYSSILNSTWIMICTVLTAGTIYMADTAYGEDVDLSPKIVKSLPGPNNQISKGSIDNLEKHLVKQDHVLGVWVAKLKYTKIENPIIWYSTKNYEVETVIKNYTASQLSGKGTSSVENDNSPEAKRILRNSTPSKNGQIVCGALSETSLPTYSPNINSVANTVCRATIPPFSDDVNLVIIVVADMLNTNNETSIKIRRALLQMQLDIFNRDYLNREVPILNNPEVYVVSQR